MEWRIVSNIWSIKLPELYFDGGLNALNSGMLNLEFCLKNLCHLLLSWVAFLLWWHVYLNFKVDQGKRQEPEKRLYILHRKRNKNYSLREKKMPFSTFVWLKVHLTNSLYGLVELHFPENKSLFSFMPFLCLSLIHEQ